MTIRGYVILTMCNLLAVALFLANNCYMRTAHVQHVEAQGRLAGKERYFRFLQDRQINIPDEYQPLPDKDIGLERDMNLALEDFLTLYPACALSVLPAILVGLFCFRSRILKKENESEAAPSDGDRPSI